MITNIDIRPIVAKYSALPMNRLRIVSRYEDARLAEIENLCSISCKDEDLSKLNEAFRSLTTVLGADIMVPIYMEHSHLGRIMEPGSWLEQDPKRGKFGVG